MKILLILIPMLLSLISSAQITVAQLDFTYDNAGNQLTRKRPSSSGGSLSSRKERVSDTIHTNVDSLGQSLIIYPNPTSNILNVTFLSQSIDIKSGSVQIIDVNGKEVYQATFDKKISVYDLSGLPSGYYVLTIMVNNSKRNFRLVKN